MIIPVFNFGFGEGWGGAEYLGADGGVRGYNFINEVSHDKYGKNHSA